MDKFFYSSKNILLLKISSYISSMLPFGLYLFISYYNDQYKFWGVSLLTPSLGSLIILICSVISSIYVIIFYKYIIKKIDYSNEYVQILNLKKEKSNTTNYLLANVLPIIGISMDTEYKSLFVIFIVFILGFMYIKNDLYSTNPLYDFLNINIYTCTVKTINKHDGNRASKEFEVTIIATQNLYHFKDKEYVAIKNGDIMFIKK